MNRKIETGLIIATVLSIICIHPVFADTSDYESIKIKDAYDETVVDTPAWDEQVCDGYVFPDGHFSPDAEDAGNYSIYCGWSYTDHYTTVHHDAVTHTVHHPEVDAWRTITDSTLQDNMLNIGIADSVPWNGVGYDIKPRITANGELLTVGKDYTVSVNGSNVTESTYQSEAVTESLPYEWDFSDGHVSGDPTERDSYASSKGVSYTAKYTNVSYTSTLADEHIEDEGTYTITFTGIGNYTGTITKTVTITPSPVKNFVTRLYEVCLTRDPDQAGLKNWTIALNSGTSARQVAYGFVMSQEFIDKNYCNDDYIACLYRAMFDRSADDAGLSSWRAVLKSYTPRENVAAGFVNSQEFSNMCASYGMSAGANVTPSGCTYQTAPCPLDGSTDSVIDFVTRMYKKCLSRDPDPSGLKTWVTDLKSKQMTGSQIAYSFFFSQEFESKNYCNDHFITYLYETLLDREPDASGKASWINNFNKGMKREDALNGFIGSPEFTKLCSDYGITRENPVPAPQYGTVPTGKCSIDGNDDNVTLFVTRMYHVCMNREPDAPGLKNWTNLLWSHQLSGSAVAYGFVFSSEFTGKHYSNSEFVEYMYKAFFNRSSDPTGKATWNGLLNSGASRESVFIGFVNSQEFTNLCNSYQITR